jgi:hypothetical protein
MGRVLLKMPPAELMLRVRDQLGIECFIETGTYRGNTSAWAAAHFPRVVTFERSDQLYRQAVHAHGHTQNIDFNLGDSREGLRRLVPSLEGPSLFWLDGHWSGGVTYGQDDECPLMEELAAITISPHAHAILIDDARLFESAPPRPHDPTQWPPIDCVIETLASRPERPTIAIIEDVIVAVPQTAGPLLVAYCQDVNTRSRAVRLASRVQNRSAGLLKVRSRY